MAGRGPVPMGVVGRARQLWLFRVAVGRQEAPVDPNLKPRHEGKPKDLRGWDQSLPPLLKMRLQEGVRPPKAPPLLDINVAP